MKEYYETGSTKETPLDQLHKLVAKEANQPKTVSNIDGNEDEACRCGSTTWLYDNEGDAALCKECWK